MRSYLEFGQITTKSSVGDDQILCQYRFELMRQDDDDEIHCTLNSLRMILSCVGGPINRSRYLMRRLSLLPSCHLFATECVTENENREILFMFVSYISTSQIEFSLILQFHDCFFAPQQ